MCRRSPAPWNVYPAKIAPDQRERILWTGPRGPDRRTLVVRVSYDQGKTFQNERLIADEPAAYSDLTLLADHSIGCLWERGDYKYITFTRFDLSFVEPRQLSFAAGENGTFTFDTGALRGVLRGEGKSFGLSAATHVPSGQKVSGTHVLLGIYRVFSDGKRYGNAGWEWPTETTVNEDGSVAVRAAAEADRPFATCATYRWSTPCMMDLDIDVTPQQDLHAFELFLASYFDGAFTNASAYVGANPQAEGKPGFMSARQELGNWLMFPRDDAAVALIKDGRWELPPNPVQWEILPKLGRAPAPAPRARQSSHRAVDGPPRGLLRDRHALRNGNAFLRLPVALRTRLRGRENRADTRTHAVARCAQRGRDRAGVSAVLEGNAVAAIERDWASGTASQL